MMAILAACLLLGMPGSDRPILQADRNAETESEIRALELNLAGLMVRGEWDAYAAFLSQDYTRISDRGEVQTRDQVLRQFRQSRPGGSMAPTELVVDSYGDTAILTGVLRVKGPDPGSPERTSRFRKVFIRRGGNWYLVSLQGVPYSPPEKGGMTTR